MEKELRNDISKRSEQLVLASKKLIQRSREIINAFQQTNGQDLDLSTRKSTAASASSVILPGSESFARIHSDFTPLFMPKGDHWEQF